MTVRTAPTLAMVQDHRQEILEMLRRHHGLSAAVFGSVARGEAGSDSDLDILVEFDPKASLFDSLHLQDELSSLLHCRVDVVSRRALKERDEHIIRESVRL